MGDERQKVTSPVASGAFVCVIGPSGAGKDTLIRLARLELGTRPGFFFPSRLITRPRSASEDHETLSPAQFEDGLRAGRFALAWQAHGLGYAIDRSILPALAAGHTVVCNVSREVVPVVREKFSHTKVVAITAPDAVLAARIAARGRETAEGLSERLARNESFVAGQQRDVRPDMTISNVGEPEDAARILAAYLVTIQEGRSSDHPSR